MEEFTEAEIKITEETRELLVSLDEKQKELTGFDSTTTSPIFLILVVIVFRPASILYDNLIAFRLSLLNYDRHRKYGSHDNYLHGCGNSWHGC
jgi:hypothetical protein